MEKWSFRGKNDRDSIKSEGKMWITFLGKGKQYRNSQFNVDKNYVNTRGGEGQRKLILYKKQSFFSHKIIYKLYK